MPDEAKLTAMGLWVHTDVFGRRRLIPELIAADLYPGRAMTDSVTDHLLMLDEAGFLTIYRVEGIECIQLARPLKADRRGATTDCPEPPQGLPWISMAVGGAGASGRASARERARAQMGEQARVRERTSGRRGRASRSGGVPRNRPVGRCWQMLRRSAAPSIHMARFRTVALAVLAGVVTIAGCPRPGTRMH